MSIESARETVERGGIKMTKTQATVLDWFAGRYDGPRTVFTHDEHGRTSYVYDNRSNTLRVMRALAKKGVFRVDQTHYTPQGWTQDVLMDRYTLVDEVAEHYNLERRARQARDAARWAERDAEEARRKEDEKNAADQAEALRAATAVLLDRHAEEFEALFLTSLAVWAGEDATMIR